MGGAELDADELEALRRINAHRAKSGRPVADPALARADLESEPMPASTDYRLLRDGPKTWLAREAVTALVVAVVAGGLAFWITESQEEERFARENARENLRFVRTATAEPNDMRRWRSFRGIYLEKVNLSGLDLREADFSGANLSRAVLEGANISGASLRGADLSGADLFDTNLRGVNLTGANLAGAHISEAYIYGANLTDVNLTGANLTDADLTGTYWDPTDPPMWPEGFTPPENAWSE